MKHIAAIPTRYNGVEFRSRLEAKWAAFFDLLKWPWDYEPIDLNGYIPDFILGFNKPLLVEVKPILKWPCQVIGCRDLKCRKDSDVEDAIVKIAKSGWNGEAILVGAAFPTKCCFNANMALGHFVIEPLENDEPRRSQSTATLFRCGKCGAPSLLSDEMSFHCRANGCYDGDGHINDFDDRDKLWREASNLTQWRGARSIASHLPRRHARVVDAAPIVPLVADDPVPPSEAAEFFANFRFDDEDDWKFNPETDIP